MKPQEESRIPAPMEHGFIQILLIALVVIAAVVGVIVAIVVGLDNMYQNDSSQSLFSDEAKITELRERLRKKKEELMAEKGTGVRTAEDPEHAQTGESSSPKTTDERLDDIHTRLKSGAP